MASQTPAHLEQKATLLSNALRAMKRAMVYAFVFSFAINVLSLLMPIYSLQVFDRVFTSRSMDTLLALTVVVLVGYCFYGVLYAIRAGVIARIVEWMERTVAPQLLAASIFQAASAGMPLAGQHQRDLMNIKNFISGAAPTLMDVPWSLIFVMVIYMINPLLGFISVIGIVMLTISALVNEYATRKPLMRASEKHVETMLHADLLGRHSEAIQAMGMGSTVIAQWTRQNSEGLALQDHAQERSAIIMGISRSLRMLLQMSVTGIGAWLALHNELSGGGLVASSILVARALAPFENTMNLWKQFIGARDAYRRLTNLLRTTDVVRGDTKLPTPRGVLSVENLYYTPPKSPPVLRGLNFSLQPGESLGIIGPSAAGKTTLGKALMGVYPPSHGNVRLDGADIFQWARDDIGQHVGYLPQQVELFMGSLKQNIARMDQDPPDELVIEAAKRAGVHEMVLQFENGYDTRYIPGNTVLSPGQKQRLGLARAIYGAPKFVVLDEPNSNLDGDGERALMGALQGLRQRGVTTIIIAHRPSILAMVDKVMMLRNGQIEIIGPRDEVLQRFSGQRKPGPQAGGNA
jgi:PrtD family type I secretion system ABC transporter